MYHGIRSLRPLFSSFCLFLFVFVFLSPIHFVVLWDEWYFLCIFNLSLALRMQIPSRLYFKLGKFLPFRYFHLKYFRGLHSAQCKTVVHLLWWPPSVSRIKCLFRWYTLAICKTKSISIQDAFRFFSVAVVFLCVPQCTFSLQVLLISREAAEIWNCSSNFPFCSCNKV